MNPKTLVVVDVQVGFIKPEYQEIPGKIRTHIEQSAYEHILFAKFINKKESNFVKLLEWEKVYDAPETDIVPELVEFATSEHTFERTAYSVFKAPGFEDFLKQNNVHAFDICGLVADSCVLASAYEGFDLGYQVNVLRDLMKTKEGLNDPTENIIKRNIDQHVK